jgi:hypothetical protein
MPEKQPQLAEWQVAIIRAMLAAGKFKKQEIVAYFSRPDRSINQGRISEIEDHHKRYKGIVPPRMPSWRSFSRTGRRSVSLRACCSALANVSCRSRGAVLTPAW